jgi:hypothetical protein
MYKLKPLNYNNPTLFINDDTSSISREKPFRIIVKSSIYTNFKRKTKNVTYKDLGFRNFDELEFNP